MAKGQSGKTKGWKRQPKKGPRPAARDDFGAYLLRRKGTISPDADLEF